MIPACKIGVVFHVMRVKESSDKILEGEVERVRETKPDALAWCFPNETRQLKSPTHSGFVSPGVIMAMKIAWSAR
jgi:hypothetical protein